MHRNRDCFGPPVLNGVGVVLRGYSAAAIPALMRFGALLTICVLKGENVTLCDKLFFIYFSKPRIYWVLRLPATPLSALHWSLVVKFSYKHIYGKGVPNGFRQGSINIFLRIWRIITGYWLLVDEGSCLIQTSNLLIVHQ